MRCVACGQPPRWDESLTLTPIPRDLGSGCFELQNVYACPKCHAQATGTELPPPKRYPKGGHIPRHPQLPDQDMPICGLCRIALPYGQRKGEVMRLRAEVLDSDDIFAGIEANDCYVSCNECLAKYRPRILKHLIANGYLPATATERQVTGGWLT